MTIQAADKTPMQDSAERRRGAAGLGTLILALGLGCGAGDSTPAPDAASPATFSAVGGSAITIVWTWARLAGAAWAQELHPGVIGLATAGVLILLVSMMTKPVASAALQKFFPENA